MWKANIECATVISVQTAIATKLKTEIIVNIVSRADVVRHFHYLAQLQYKIRKLKIMLKIIGLSVGNAYNLKTIIFVQTK